MVNFLNFFLVKLKREKSSLINFPFKNPFGTVPVFFLVGFPGLLVAPGVFLSSC